MRGRGGGAVAVSSVEALRQHVHSRPRTSLEATLDTLVACAARNSSSRDPGQRRPTEHRAHPLPCAPTTAKGGGRPVCLRQTYLGRLDTPADIASAVAFLTPPRWPWRDPQSTAGVAQPRDQVDRSRKNHRPQHERQQGLAQRGGPDGAGFQIGVGHLIRHTDRER